MGNNSGKKETDPNLKNLDDLFFTISNKKRHILKNDLKEAWEKQIDKDLYKDVELYLFKINQNELTSQVFKSFYLSICKGTLDQKVEVLYQLIFDQEKISRTKLLKFIRSILNSILIIQKHKVPKKYNSWTTRLGSKPTTESIDEYSKYFVSKINKNEKDEYTKEDLNLLQIHIDFFLYMILSQIYDAEEKHFYKNVLPEWKCSSLDFGKTLEQISELNILKVIFLNLELPFDCRNKWRPLFSTQINGENFARLSGQIINQGPTIILVKDKDGYIFGGFASQSWTLGPTFFGDSSSFLFTLYPKMNIYKATNFNDNYQYMNINQQTMPNGLGMGGKVEYFGLWISAEFGKGYCSESCTSFRDYKMLSKNKNFEISHLEVWGVGMPLSTSSELGERSVLDSNLEAKVMLELTGKMAYSEGFREE